jgi:hypothetical protein
VTAASYVEPLQELPFEAVPRLRALLGVDQITLGTDLRKKS